MVYSIKGKKLHAHTCKKYPRTCPSTMTKSAEFLIFTIVFLHPFFLSLSLLSLIFFLPSSLWIFFRIIYYGFYTSSSLHVWVKRWESFFSVLPYLLEPSTLRRKVACSLFRHHLHINVVRELARQHLMRG